MKRATVALLVGSVLALVGATPAVAMGGDPPGFGPVHVDCGGGLDFNIVDQGNGQWVPGHILSSTGQFIVTAFPAFHIEIWIDTDEDGNPDTKVLEENRPPVFKGNGNGGPKEAGRHLTCTFDFDVTFADGTRVAGFGVVRGFLTPAKS